MTERDGNLAAFLDGLFPRRDEERGDWDGVVTDARSNLRLRRSLAPTRRRRAVLALAVVAGLTVLTVMPALAVSQWLVVPPRPRPETDQPRCSRDKPPTR